MTKPSQAEEIAREIHKAMEAALYSYRCEHTRELADPDNGLCLIDLLTPECDSDVARGREEMDSLAEYIWSEINSVAIIERHLIVPDEARVNEIREVLRSIVKPPYCIERGVFGNDDDLVICLDYKIPGEGHPTPVANFFYDAPTEEGYEGYPIKRVEAEALAKFWVNAPMWIEYLLSLVGRADGSAKFESALLKIRVALGLDLHKIGRASCRERVYVLV